ncbi:hypothetical protein [Oligoflexus tunisiensis]|uniref:hypothetical protein n=1 Tax=Oligoflexus tunisiensis TaxID=708132 RepID=UPI00114C9F6C|nr:hypothetical protein [Oligoflexus tunisiensis]
MKLDRDADGLVLVDDIDRDLARIEGKYYEIDETVSWKLKLALAGLNGVRVRLASDRDVPYPEEEPLRRAHWYGPKFDISTIDEKKHNSKTLHGDTDEIRNIQYGVNCKAFFDWQYPQREKIAILQIELFIFEMSAHYRSLYLHSIRNREQRKFTHLDGAVKTYSDEVSYLKSFEGGLIKSQNYQKSFRMDGVISDEHWRNIIGAFFDSNPLINDYFQGMNSI